VISLTCFGSRLGLFKAAEDGDTAAIAISGCAAATLQPAGDKRQTLGSFVQKQ